jgi:hypothetical protein
MARIELAKQTKRDEMFARWLAFECSDEGRRALARPGCGKFASNPQQTSPSPLSPAGPAAGGGGEPFQPAGKKKGKAQPGAPQADPRADDKGPAEEDIMFGTLDGSAVIKKGGAKEEDLGRLLDATLSDDVSGATFLQTLDVNQITIDKAFITEQEIYKLVKWYSTGNPVMTRAVREVDQMGAPALANSATTTELGRMLGVHPKAHLAIQKACSSIVLVEETIAHKESAKLTFLHFGNNAQNFNTAMKCYVTGAGDRIQHGHEVLRHRRR